MFAGLQRGQRRRGVAVDTLEEGVDGRRYGGIASAASATRIDRVRWRWATIAQAPQQTCRLNLVALVVLYRIEANEEAMTAQQCQKSIKKSWIVRRAETKALTQKPAECAAFVEAESIHSPRRPPELDEAVGRAQFVEVGVKPPEFVEMLLGTTTHLLLGGFLEAAHGNRQFTAKLIQHRAREPFSIRWWQRCYRWMEAPPRVIGTE